MNSRARLPPTSSEFFDYLVAHNSSSAGAHIQEILQAIALLENSPLIGRVVKNGKRELIVGRGSHGYLVLYRYAPDIDTVFVLAIRSQRELRYT